MEMRDAIREERTCEVSFSLFQRLQQANHYTAIVSHVLNRRLLQVCLINYKQSGDKFWNQFYLAPVLDENSCVSHYMGIQSDVSHLMAQDGLSQTAGRITANLSQLQCLLCQC